MYIFILFLFDINMISYAFANYLLGYCAEQPFARVEPAELGAPPVTEHSFP